MAYNPSPRRRDDYFERRLQRRSPGTVTKVETPYGETLASRNWKGDMVSRDGVEGGDPVSLAIDQLSRDNATPPSREPFSALTGKVNETPYGTISSLPPETQEEVVAREWEERINGKPPARNTYLDPETGETVDFKSTLPESRTINGKPASDYRYTEQPERAFTAADYLRETGRGAAVSRLGLDRPGNEKGAPVELTPAQAKVAEAEQRQTRLTRAFQNPDVADPITGERQGDDPEYQAWLEAENERRSASGLGPVGEAFADFRSDKATEAQVNEIQAGLLRRFSKDSQASRLVTNRRGGAPDRVRSTTRRSRAFTDALNERTRDMALRIARGESPDSDLLMSDMQDLQNAAQGGAFVPKTTEQVVANQGAKSNQNTLSDKEDAREQTQALSVALAKARTPLEIEEAIQKYALAGSTAQGKALISGYDQELAAQNPDAMQHARDLRRKGIPADKAMARGRYFSEFQKAIQELKDVGGFDEQYLIDNGVYDANGGIDGKKLGPLVEKQKTVASQINALQKRLSSSSISQDEEARIINKINELQEARFGKEIKPKGTFPDGSTVPKDGEYLIQNGKRYLMTNGVPIPVK